MTSRRCRRAVSALTVALLTLPIACDGERDGRRRVESRVRLSRFDPDLIGALRNPKRPSVHGLLSFREPLSREQHEALRRAKVTLLGYLGNETYFASIPAGAVPGVGPLAALAGAELWRPADKIDSSLLRDSPPWWIRRGPGRVAVVIEVFEDSSPDEVVAQVPGVHLDGVRIGTVTLAVEVALSDLRALARLDAVKRIHPGRIPSLPLTEVQRATTGTDAVQAVDLATSPRPTYRVDGAPIHVAICDEGINVDHSDFKGVAADGSPDTLRVSPTRPSSSEHGTHVASIVASSGYGSELAGLNPFERRGHAPLALLGDFEAFGADLERTHEALVDRGMQLSNHSYVQSRIIYDPWAADLDRIVRGDATYGGAPIPARPQVWAVGNNGSRAQYPSVSAAAGYYSAFTSAKNTISVGSVSAPNGNLSAFTSLGPTLDGRIKPDLVAPGCHAPAGILAASDGYAGGYSGDCGTSYSAPAVTGILALVMQRLEASGSNLAVILPSTYKALLVHGARDLSEPSPRDTDEGFINPDTKQQVGFHPGPDFATGWGLVSAEATLQLAEHPEQWTEGGIEVQGVSAEYCIEVPDDSGELKVAIAWDDLPGETGPPETSARLVNDLDLKLLEPGPLGETVLPWVVTAPPITETLEHGIVESFGAEDVEPAVRGVDHLNNVEMAQEPEPAAGTWRAIVTAYRLPKATGQRYSLVASHPLLEECR